MSVYAPDRTASAGAGPIQEGLPGADAAIRLGSAPVGLKARVVGIKVPAGTALSGLAAEELERRLLEMGFVEGASVEILHQGLIRRDPIAVRLDDMRVALRRQEADAVLVQAVGGTARGR